MPDSIGRLEVGTFYNCGNLLKICYGGTRDEWESITFIDEYTFGYCSKLSRVIIPDRVTQIRNLAFRGCNNLLMVCYGGTRDEWKSIYFESGNDDLTQTLIHYNENNDHLCDTCGYVVGICRDRNSDHNCDRCGSVMNECYDDDGDHYCDICWKELPAGIKRLGGGNRFETATLVADQMKEVLGMEKFDAVILANGYNFADALAGSYLSAMKKAPILLTWNGAEKYNYLNDATIAYVKANLKPGGTVYILGGTSAVPASIDKALSGFTIKRMDGTNRFETNLLILEEAGIADGAEVLVCTSTNFADSLSASAAGKPILLVFNESGKLYGDQPKFLSNLKNCTFTVIGGENAVSKKLADAFGKYGKVTRLAGKNRFETSVLVAEKYFPEATSAVLAYAWDFPDGLCGGGLAYAMKAPLILTMTKYESQAADYIQSQGIKSGVVLGGEKLISDEAVRAIFAMETADEIDVK